MAINFGLDDEYVRGMVDALLAELLPLEGQNELRLLNALNGLFNGDDAPRGHFVAFSTAGGRWVATAAAGELDQDELEQWCAAMQDFIEDRFLVEPAPPLRPSPGLKPTRPETMADTLAHLDDWMTKPSPWAMDLEGNFTPVPPKR